MQLLLRHFFNVKQQHSSRANDTFRFQLNSDNLRIIGHNDMKLRTKTFVHPTMDEVAQGQIFSEFVGFPLPVLIPSTVSYLLIILLSTLYSHDNHSVVK
jgi:hypothetical protein